MKMRILVSSAMVSLVLAGPGTNESGAAVDREHAIMIPGTVVSSDSRTLIIRTDDHGHRMPVEVRVIERSADTRSQASFRTVTGPADTRVSAR